MGFCNKLSNRVKNLKEISAFDLEKIQTLEQNLGDFQRKSSKIFEKSKTLLENFQIHEKNEKNIGNETKKRAIYKDFNTNTNELNTPSFSMNRESFFEKDGIVNLPTFTNKKATFGIMPGEFYEILIIY